MDLGDVAALLAAFGFGSVGSTVLARAREERGSRAAVLAALGDVESRRWYDPSDQPFSAALREFQSSALVARVPWRVVDGYVAAARLGYWLSHENWRESNGEDEYAGGIPSEAAEVIRSHSLLVVSMVWRPFLSRLTLRRRIRELDVEIGRLPERLRNRFVEALRTS